jgi:hypothetical protein
MKTLPLLLVVLLVGCGPTPAPTSAVSQIKYVKPDQDGCVTETSSTLVNEHKVGPITNLVKDKFDWGNKGECTVRFDITVNGEVHHLEESETGLEQLESLCYYARERARKNLLLDLGGTFNTQANIACLRKDS